jgi:5S rRNA maturation endonuclease (ribonuclease M5)
MSIRADVLIPAIERTTGRAGTRVGRNTRLLCPVHDDHHPSLDVAEADDGSALVYCRSHGCTYEQVLAAVGLSETSSNGEWTPFGEAVAVYRYEDEQRAELYEVVRTESKQFPQRRRDTTQKSGWRWKLDDVRRVLYRLPELIEAMERGDTVYVVEGEKDVERLRSLGVAATCNPGGAGKWRHEYAPVFAAARVIVIADRDAPGIEHARTVVASLERVGARVELLLPKIESAHADVSDHLAAGYALDDLVTLDETPAIVPALEVVTARAFMLKPDPSEDYELLGPLVGRGARTIIVGDTGHGKTTLALQMLAAIVKGETMLDRNGASAAPGLIVDLEQGQRSIKRSLHDAQLDEHDDVHVLSQPDGLALDSDDDLAQFEAVLEDLWPVVVLLDPYYKAHRADDPNAERLIIDLMRRLDALRKRFGFALLLPAHARKADSKTSGTRKLRLDDVAGSGALTRGAEIVLAIERKHPGAARMRYLKDRDTDLPIGDHVDLLFARGEGFRLDTSDDRDQASDAEIAEQLLASDTDEWLTATDWAAKLSRQAAQVRRVLRELTDDGRMIFVKGPPGRHATAQCYRRAQDVLTVFDDPSPEGLSGLAGQPRTTYQPQADLVGRPSSPPPERGESKADDLTAPEKLSGQPLGATPFDDDLDDPFGE